jgi:hypothetical protein
MKTLEEIPNEQPIPAEEVEKFESVSGIDPYLATLIQKREEQKAGKFEYEKDKAALETQKTLNALRGQIELAQQTEERLSKEDVNPDDEHTALRLYQRAVKNPVEIQEEQAANPEPKKNKFFNWFKNPFKKVAVVTGLTLSSIAAHSETAHTETNPTDSAKNKTEFIKKTPEDSLATNKNTVSIKVYQGGKTKEGATTPTGFNNSFLNNEYNIHEGDVEAVAKQFGFRTDNVEDFQADMFGYLEKNYPEDMKNVVKKYGMPAAGKMTDAILGVRVAFAMKILKDKVPSNNVEKKESDPYAAFAESGEVLYTTGPGGHAFAELCYPIRSSASIKDGGMLDASKQPVLIRFRNDFGFTGEVSLMTDEAYRKAMGTTSNHARDEVSIALLKENLVNLSKNKTHTFTGAEFAKGNTQ